VHNKSSTNECRGGHLWTGIAAGLAGGLAASWAMNRFQDVWSRLAEANEESPDARTLDRASKPEAEQRRLQADSVAQEDTTVRAASAISEGLFQHKLTSSEKKIGGTAVHYTLGTSVGALYGTVAEFAPKVTAGGGLLFGTAFWLVIDEGAVPLFGLSKGPAEYPLSTHLYALASHHVYGLTAEAVRGAVRNAL
jgi:hypothetical protein